MRRDQKQLAALAWAVALHRVGRRTHDHHTAGLRVGGGAFR